MITDTDATSPARPSFRRRAATPLTAVAVVAAVGLITAACGSSSPSTSPTTLPRSPAGTSSATTKASGTTVVNAQSNATLGSTILVNTSGMSVYTLSADTGGMSSCTTTCASIWPPLTVAAGVTPAGGSGTGGTFATITRPDGTLQVTYNGQPLYLFVGDKSAGATTGNGIKSFGGTWSVVKVGNTAPGGSPGTTAPMTTTTKASGGGYGY